MENLVTAIRAVTPEVVTEWNTVKLPLFEQLVGQSFEQYFQGRQTQEKTKIAYIYGFFLSLCAWHKICHSLSLLTVKFSHKPGRAAR